VSNILSLLVVAVADNLEAAVVALVDFAQML
jgi:hypothetical protein